VQGPFKRRALGLPERASTSVPRGELKTASTQGKHAGFTGIALQGGIAPVLQDCESPYGSMCFEQHWKHCMLLNVRQSVGQGCKGSYVCIEIAEPSD